MLMFSDSVKSLAKSTLSSQTIVWMIMTHLLSYGIITMYLAWLAIVTFLKEKPTSAHTNQRMAQGRQTRHADR
jgi:hypothetical protein